MRAPHTGSSAIAEISVEPAGKDTYRVIVSQDGPATTHWVAVASSDVERYGGAPAEQLLEASFRFLLDREPQESILDRFDINVIARYFPEYPSTIGEYLGEESGAT